MNVRGTVVLLCVFLSAASNLCAETITFGSGETAFDMEFVAIGDVDNPPDVSRQGFGSVGYPFAIGKFEVTVGQLYKASLAGLVGPIFGSSPSNPQRPLTSIAFVEAIEFANWLNTSQGYPPAYMISDATAFIDVWPSDHPGFDPANPVRNSLARFALPTVDEWHKAAFYDPLTGTYNSFATGNEVPTNVPDEGGTAPNTARFSGPVVDVQLAGGLSAYGTVGQGGNAWEWEETPFHIDQGFPGIQRAARIQRPFEQPETIRWNSPRGPGGFRVMMVPEPSAVTLSLLPLLFALHLRRRRK